jgi:hypothetical protein
MMAPAIRPTACGQAIIKLSLSGGAAPTTSDGVVEEKIVPYERLRIGASQLKSPVSSPLTRCFLDRQSASIGPAPQYSDGVGDALNPDTKIKLPCYGHSEFCRS